MNDTVTIAQARLRLEDPHDSTDANDVLTVFDMFFDALVRYGADGQYLPSLATDWSTSDDAREWTFNIRSAVRFHDGEPLTAETVCRSLKRMARADKGYTLGAPGVWHQYLGNAVIEAVTSQSIRIVLKDPVADLLDILVYGYVVSSACLEQLESGNTSDPVGTGPYCFESFRDGSELIAFRNDDWFGKAPANRRLRFCLEPDAKRRQALLLSGEAQIANSLNFVVSLDIEKDKFHRVTSLVPVAIIYLFNCARGPLSDPRVRHALNLAIDRQILIDSVVDGAARPLTGFVSPVHFGSDANSSPARNIDEARRLMAEAGYAEGVKLHVDCPTRLPDEAQRLTQAVEAQLQEIGVSFEVHLHEDREAYAHMIRRKEIRDLCVFDSSPLSTFRVLYEKIDARVGGSWWQGYHNPHVECLIDIGRATQDVTAREEIYQQAYRSLQDNPPWLYLYNPLRVTGLANHDQDLNGDWNRNWAMRRDGVLDVSTLPTFS